MLQHGIVLETRLSDSFAHIDIKSVENSGQAPRLLGTFGLFGRNLASPAICLAALPRKR